MNNLKKKKIVIHNDFTNFLINTEKADDPLNLEKAAHRELLSKADIISLAVGVNQGNCYYYPTKAGGIIGADGKKDIHGGAVMRALTASGIDPYGLVLDQLHRDGCTVLAKLRVNDCHHVAGHTALQSKFWLEHPEWRIGTIEKTGGGEISFDSTPCVGPEYHKMIARTRGLLLDYAVPEVFEYRLSLVREFMERYDVDGLTLNFLRDEFCISFPSKNAPILTDFVAACRRIVDKSVGKRGKSDPIMGAIVPWDPDYCREMGFEVERWISDGLLDYVSPTDTWVTEFNMAVSPWVKIASPNRCAVYPGIIGLTSHDNDVCLPQEYETEGLGVNGKRQGSSKVTSENIRALVHGFYAEGADGVSFFNFYSAFYNNLYPLPEICMPENIEGKERRYIYMKEAPLFGEWGFLRLVLQQGSSERKAIKCRLHEDLKKIRAFVRFKACGLADIAYLKVDINNNEIPNNSLSLIPYKGEGFLYVTFELKDGMINDGINEIGFTFLGECAAASRDVVIQELEIRVQPDLRSVPGNKGKRR